MGGGPWFWNAQSRLNIRRADNDGFQAAHNIQSHGQLKLEVQRDYFDQRMEGPWNLKILLQLLPSYQCKS